MNYGTVRVLPATGNGVHGYGYGVGKPDPRYTRVNPSSSLQPFIHQAFLSSKDTRGIFAVARLMIAFFTHDLVGRMVFNKW